MQSHRKADTPLNSTSGDPRKPLKKKKKNGKQKQKEVIRERARSSESEAHIHEHFLFLSPFHGSQLPKVFRAASFRLCDVHEGQYKDKIQTNDKMECFGF